MNITAGGELEVPPTLDTSNNLVSQSPVEGMGRVCGS